MNNDAYIYDAIRTPRGKGKPGGGLYEVKPIDLVTNLLEAMKERHDLDTTQVEDVILATGEPVKEQGQNIAKTALVYSSWDDVTVGAQLHRYCAGGLDAVNTVAMKIMSGMESMGLAGGVESMSRLGMGASGAAMGDAWVAMKSYGISQGLAADLMAALDQPFPVETSDPKALQKVSLKAHVKANAKKVSITDGQLYLETDLFNAGIKPALNVGISVSRVGSAAQSKAMKQVAGRLKLDMGQYREVAAFAQFGAAELDKATKAQLDRGQRITEILKQPQSAPMLIEKQVMILYAAINGYIDDVPVEKVVTFEANFHQFMEANHPEVGKSIVKDKDITAKTEEALKAALEEFKKGWDIELTSAKSDRSSKAEDKKKEKKEKSKE